MPRYFWMAADENASSVYVKGIPSKEEMSVTCTPQEEGFFEGLVCTVFVNSI